MVFSMMTRSPFPQSCLSYFYTHEDVKLITIKAQNKIPRVSWIPLHHRDHSDSRDPPASMLRSTRKPRTSRGTQPQKKTNFTWPHEQDYLLLRRYVSKPFHPYRFSPKPLDQVTKLAWARSSQYSRPSLNKGQQWESWWSSFWPRWARSDLPAVTKQS